MARGILDILDLTTGELDEIIALATDIMEHPDAYKDRFRGKKLATLFYEPSTRTRLSFEAAMIELGGSVIGFPDGANSSAAKGESLADTATVMSAYADVIAMRHPKDGSAAVMAAHATVPFINAGDGGHCHPTQTLADLMTIYREKGRFDNLVVGLCGDLKYGRTVHSLAGAMSRYPGVSFVLISPEELKMPSFVKKGILKAKGIPYTQTTSLEDVLPDLDILYMTRVQRERFADPAVYEALKDSYELTAAKLAGIRADGTQGKPAKDDMIILHPLPRLTEIAVDVDQDPRACYFKQVLYGKYMRAALITYLLEGHSFEQPTDRVAVAPQGATESLLKARLGEAEFVYDRVCENERCITTLEPALTQTAWLADADSGIYRCIYCENKVY